VQVRPSADTTEARSRRAIPDRSNRGGVIGFVLQRPALSIFLLAFVIRLLVITGVILFTDHVVIPDEIQYLTLAQRAADHQLTSTLWNGYGRSLYHATATFMWPLTALYWLLWPFRGFAMILVALAGAGTAAFTTATALALLPRRWAMAAGGIVALLPSQVLWSSVVLRESFVWFLLAAVGYACTSLALGRGRARTSLALVLLACVGLGYLREQTMIVAAWAVPAVLILGPRRRRLSLGLAGCVIALVAPFISGSGLGGASLLKKAVPSLGSTRAYMSMNAKSAFVPTTVVATRPPVGTPTTVAPAAPDRHAEIVNNKTGEVYSVDEGVDTNLRAFPPGLLAVTLRPLPWESTESLTLTLAQIEQPAWYALYALAGIGLWVERRRWRALLPAVTLVGGIVIVAAVTQGNLGTAFRHRGQIVWALAVPAACGAQHVWGRVALHRTLRRRRRPAPA
jgi:hypothetical protein